jgi:preprotein translocase subunit SecG
MEHVILVVHLILALSLIGLILLQRSEGGGLGIGGGGGGMGALAGAGSTANALTRATGIVATCFFVTSLTLAVLAGTHHGQGSMLDSLDNTPPAVSGEAAPAVEGTKPSTTPSKKAADNAAEKIDSEAPKSDKDLPKAPDKPEPQSGAPSAPISQ